MTPATHIAYIVESDLRVLSRGPRGAIRTQSFALDELGLARLAAECGQALHSIVQRQCKTGAWTTRRNLKTKGR